MDPRAGLDGCGKSRPPPGFDPRIVQSKILAATNFKDREVEVQRTRTDINRSEKFVRLHDKCLHCGRHCVCVCVWKYWDSSTIKWELPLLEAKVNDPTHMHWKLNLWQNDSPPKKKNTSARVCVRACVRARGCYVVQQHPSKSLTFPKLCAITLQTGKLRADTEYCDIFNSCIFVTYPTTSTARIFLWPKINCFC